jgi:CubicO group peptidase (beta-lactamase class C family)
MIVLRNGCLVMEWYASDLTRDHNHYVFSVTKSVVSTLIGIAIKKRYIRSVDSPIKSYFPGTIGFQTDRRRAGIKLKHVLSMSSGIEWTESNGLTQDANDPFQKMVQARDRVAHVLNLEMAQSPGKVFNYSNADAQLLIPIIEKAIRQNVLAFAEKNLFQPLGFENYEWVLPDQTGTLPGGYGIRLRTIDMAKLGQLYLQKGLWRGGRLLTRDWVDQATTDQTGRGYGYMWWTRVSGGTHLSYAAIGLHGQYIQIIPDLNLVFVMTSYIKPDQADLVRDFLVGNYLVQAVLSSRPMGENYREQKLLREEILQSKSYHPDNDDKPDAWEVPHAPQE